LPTDLHGNPATDEGITGAWSALDRELADGVTPAVIDRRRLGRWRLAVGSRVPVEAAGVTTEVVGMVDRGLLPSALMVSERSYRRMFPTDEGYRVWLLEVPSPRVPAIVDALTTALEPVGARVRTAGEVHADEGAAADAAQRAWRALSVAGLLLGVLGAVLLR
jgi:putative ABC transport system permease protein